MSVGPDFYLNWNGDYILTPNGSVQTAVGWDRTRQRITRRILSTPATQNPDGSFTPATCLFAQDFGIGLPLAVDKPTDNNAEQIIRRNISRGVLEDADVLSTSPPSVLLRQVTPTEVLIVIGVTLKNGQPGMIALGAS